MTLFPFVSDARVLFRQGCFSGAMIIAWHPSDDILFLNSNFLNWTNGDIDLIGVEQNCMYALKLVKY